MMGMGFNVQFIVVNMIYVGEVGKRFLAVRVKEVYIQKEFDVCIIIFLLVVKEEFLFFGVDDV